MLSPQEYREQADQCIGWARAAVSDSERKLYRQLAVFWLENAVRLEPRAIELPVALAVISPTRRQRKRSGDKNLSPEKRAARPNRRDCPLETLGNRSIAKSLLA